MFKLLLAKCGWKLGLWLAVSCLCPEEPLPEPHSPTAAEENAPIVLPIVPGARHLVVQPGAEADSIALLFADEQGLPLAAALVRRDQPAGIAPAAATPPRPLHFAAERFQTDSRLEALQRTYRRQLESGALDEAAETAAELLLPSAPDGPVPADWIEVPDSPSGRRHHRVGYGFRDAAGPAGSSGQAWQRPFDWPAIAQRPISFDFQGASVTDVATFFRHAAGVPVRLDLPADRLAGSGPGIHVRCVGKPVAGALQIVLASCGLGYVVEADGIRITEPDRVDRLVIGTPRPHQDAWRPPKASATAIRADNRRF